MSDQPHTRGDAGALEDDFEWVNAWAASMRPVPPAPASGGYRAADARTETPSPVRMRTERTAAADKVGAGDAGSRAARARDGNDALATLAGESVPSALAGRRPRRWTSLFRRASRASSPEADPARELFVLDPSGAPAVLTDTGGKPASTAAAGDADQLARDIAEITHRHDQLLALATRSAGGPKASRTSDYVPILVGGVLALIVFGAAVSFVSLR